MRGRVGRFVYSELRHEEAGSSTQLRRNESRFGARRGSEGEGELSTSEHFETWYGQGTTLYNYRVLPNVPASWKFRPRVGVCSLT